MIKNLPKWLLYSALFILYLLHNDLWLWNDPTFVLGLPIGLLYHIIFCVAASFLFISIVKNIWPTHLEVETEEDLTRINRKSEA